MKKGHNKVANLAKKAHTPGLGRKQRVLHTGCCGDKHHGRGGKSHNPGKSSY